MTRHLSKGFTRVSVGGTDQEMGRPGTFVSVHSGLGTVVPPFRMYSLGVPFPCWCVPCAQRYCL